MRGLLVTFYGLDRNRFLLVYFLFFDSIMKYSRLRWEEVVQVAIPTTE